MEKRPVDLVSEFFEQYPLRHVPKGQILVYINDDPPGIFYLVKGSVRQYDVSHSGEEVVVNVFKPPAFFPMSWGINRTPNRYFFSAATDTSYRQAPVEEVMEFLQTHPAVVFDLLRRVYMGVEGLQRRMAHLMGGNAKTRCLYELILETNRFGSRDEDGVYEIEMTEAEIGRRAGLSRETVSREFKKLHDKGLIERRDNTILIPDLGALEKVLGDDL